VPSLSGISARRSVIVCCVDIRVSSYVSNAEDLEKKHTHIHMNIQKIKTCEVKGGKEALSVLLSSLQQTIDDLNLAAFSNLDKYIYKCIRYPFVSHLPHRLVCVFLMTSDAPHSQTVQCIRGYLCHSVRVIV